MKMSDKTSSSCHTLAELVNFKKKKNSAHFCVMYNSDLWNFPFQVCRRPPARPILNMRTHIDCWHNLNHQKKNLNFWLKCERWYPFHPPCANIPWKIFEFVWLYVALIPLCSAHCSTANWLDLDSLLQYSNFHWRLLKGDEKVHFQFAIPTDGWPWIWQLHRIYVSLKKGQNAPKAHQPKCNILLLWQHL